MRYNGLGRRFTLTVATALLLVVSSANAASVSTRFSVTANVVGRTLLTVDSAPQTIDVTATDIARGYVDVVTPLAFHVRSNTPSGYFLSFERADGAFSTVMIRWSNNEVSVGAAPALLAQPYQQGTSTVTAAVRLTLAQGAIPGTYAWPLQLDAVSR